MRKWILAAAALAALAIPASAQVHVQGYYRADGTYVAPYYRTAPDNTINNNYSTYPNVNPYTGQQGTVAPNPYQQGYAGPPAYGSPYGSSYAQPRPYYAPSPYGSSYGH